MVYIISVGSSYIASKLCLSNISFYIGIFLRHIDTMDTIYSIFANTTVPLPDLISRNTANVISINSK